jgi:hypothetical protein
MRLSETNNITNYYNIQIYLKLAKLFGTLSVWSHKPNHFIISDYIKRHFGSFVYIFTNYTEK